MQWLAAAHAALRRKQRSCLQFHAGCPAAQQARHMLLPCAACRPGAEQQPWVQSQTTFAVLHREDDGSFAVRTTKQKIWVEGVSYELQV